jgi:hypothetical protein
MPAKIIEVDDEALATARKMVEICTSEHVAVFLAALMKKARIGGRPWLPIATVSPTLAAYEVRGVYFREANSPGRLEHTHWRPLPGQEEG